MLISLSKFVYFEKKKASKTFEAGEFDVLTDGALQSQLDDIATNSPFKVDE